MHSIRFLSSKKQKIASGVSGQNFNSNFVELLILAQTEAKELQNSVCLFVCQISLICLYERLSVIGSDRPF